MAYVILATWQARAGRERDVADTIAELTEASRREPGCRYYQGQVSIQTLGQFVIYENYDDVAAAEVHSGSDHFRRLVLERASELLESRSRRIFETV